MPPSIWDTPGQQVVRDPQPRALTAPAAESGDLPASVPVALQDTLNSGTHVRPVGRQGNPTGDLQSRVEEESLRVEQYPIMRGYAARLRAATRRALGR